MNDPWDVKSVRQPGQYLSCMKINGVPLLPPILSKGCRKEMQYYKLLAKEVEKRIAHLKQYVYDNSSDSEDKTDAPELPECEQSYDLAEEEIQSGFNVNIGSVKAVTNTEQSAEITPRGKDISKIANRGSSPAPKFFIDLNLTINETGTKILSTAQKAESPPGLEVPERDYNCVSRFTQQVITEKEVVTTVETCRNIEKKNIENNFDFCDKKDGSLSDPITEIPLSPDGPSSLSSKRFTGSLDNLHREITKDSLKNNSQLVRQRSYTLLYPSPQLLAHLEIHSQNTGIEMSSISMSESLSNMSSPGKKRRSWDLESAKVKWSNMALELKQKSVANVINTVAKNIPKPEPKQNISLRAKSVDPAVARRNNPITRVLPKSEPITKNKSVSVTRNHVNSRSLDQQPAASSLKTKVEHSLKNPTTPVSEVADPATRVRELYEKIQKQQLVQMENLVEKQKKEQLLLQQVFEEQNNMLFKQLKTICPKSPIEAKEAWSDKQCEGDRGPVSLSQLINYKSSTLTDTNSYLNHCDNVLKKSRNITGSLKKVQATSNGKNGTKIQSPTKQSDGSRTRTHSPAKNPTSRRLNYDTSASSDRDYEPMLTDRTNDTMADLNVTFPSDNSDEGNYNNNVVNQLCSKITKPSNGSSVHTNSVIHSRVTEKTIKNVGRSVNSSMQNSSTRTSKLTSYKHVPNPRELEAATKIVAHAKGYLVRRLMRTERVQGIVQTIKDALLCALQLHQDREGIRGADVDLHRRLIQQITAACYSLHDTFVASTAAERCAMIAADRGRRHSLAARQPMSFRQTDIMTQSHSGSFPARTKRQPSSLMTQSNYEIYVENLKSDSCRCAVARNLYAASRQKTFSGEKSSPVSRRYVASPRRRPWR